MKNHDQHSGNKEQSMSHRTFKNVLNFANKWDDICVVCGNEFMNAACITKEHILPKCRVGSNTPPEFGPNPNLAPSHYTCNQLKRHGSIFAAVKKINKKRAEINDDVRFLKWLNKPVPLKIRKVPTHAFLPLLDARWFVFVDIDT